MGLFSSSASSSASDVTQGAQSELGDAVNINVTGDDKSSSSITINDVSAPVVASVASLAESFGEDARAVIENVTAAQSAVLENTAKSISGLAETIATDGQSNLLDSLPVKSLPFLLAGVAAVFFWSKRAA